MATLVNIKPNPRVSADDWSKEAHALESELRKKIAGEVRFDIGSRALYASDLSIYRQVPIGVVIPKQMEDVFETVEACRRRDVPILARGCGTSLAGQTCNVAVVIDFSKYLNQLLELDPYRCYARVQPGIICDQLRHAAERFHLTFGPDPATHKYCTLGGMLGNNSCGAHSVMAGKTVDNVEELEILTYDGLHLTVGKTSEFELARKMRDAGRTGEIYKSLKKLRDRYGKEIRDRYPQIPRRVSGYNLDELLPENEFHVARSLIGSESTCALILSAKLKLVPSPAKRALLVIAYPDMFTAADHAADLRALNPIALEAFQKHVIENMHRKGKPVGGVDLLPKGDTWVLVEFGAETEAEAAAEAEHAKRKVERSMSGHLEMKVFSDAGDQQSIWQTREDGVGASRVPGEEDAWPSWEDTAVAPEKLGNYLRDFYKIVDRHGYKMTIFGHFGDGCMHTRLTFNLKTAAGVRNFRSFMEEATDLVVSYGGSLSGEHGDGQAKGELLPKMFGSELMQAFREFKSIWDPHWRMNPGKVVDAYPLDSNLRAGPDYRPQPVFTHFKFPEDHGSFAEATERCFGVGKCRSLDSGTMCPSFRATREEKHTTRGRARLLFEMLRGDSIQEGWQDAHVKEALDLCLSCKGCKGDCPVSVDVATYKAEFLSHYYESKPRPRTAYALGLINEWAQLASLMPGAFNIITQTPALAEIAKKAAEISPHRSLPPIAPTTFRAWFQKRKSRKRDHRADTRQKVLLWADTFNNYFHPDIAHAAVEVLESAGFDLIVPEKPLCCGRPLFDFGMLDRAKSYLQKVLSNLRQDLTSGVPIVVLEPSCAAVFRDELCNLMPADEDAARMKSQTFLLSEFLQKKAPDFQIPKLERRAIVHGHCHHKAIMQMDDEIALLKRLGLDFEVLDDGCCGMAGSFGFEEEKYDVSIRCAEHGLLPAIRKAESDAFIIANGFSCQEQIRQLTNREALHIAQVIQLALHNGRGLNGDPPEQSMVERREKEVKASMLKTSSALVSAGLAAAALWYAAVKRNSNGTEAAAQQN
ncbi:MAG TPA: FAD-linked oxidase C-terminal domain-containing protein [Terriglobales bacterium]|nr:FAD-linked oxidase C-terminal domain-containing protein [Terriglobales bacterium]